MPHLIILRPEDADEERASTTRIARRSAAELEARLGREPTAIEVGNDCGLFFWDISEVMPHLRIPGAYQHPQIRGAVWAKTNGRCWYCGWRMNPFVNFTVDHVQPRAAGGKDNLANLVPCCRDCNSAKGTRSLLEFRRTRVGGDDAVFWFEKMGLSS